MFRFLHKQNRSLLAELVRTDFKLRYQNSVLGYLWSLLRPLMLFTILYFVFVKVIHVDFGVPHSAVYLLLGIVLWNFFNEMTNQSLGSIVDRGDLIRKIRIPRWIIILSSSVSALINLGLNLVVVFVFMVVNRADFFKSTLLLPVILLEIYLFSLGLSLLLSAAYVKYRDVRYIWEVILQGLFYLTPILYPIAIIKNITLEKIILISPLGQAIQDARHAVVAKQTTTAHELFQGGWYGYIPYGITLLVLVIGLLYFRRESKYFAENI